MKIGLIDCDKKSKTLFPNLALMKLSSWHKAQGDSVEWYSPDNGFFDRVYVSKVFSFSPDYEKPINAYDIIRGGSGFAIQLNHGREYYNKSDDPDLPPEIDHIYPDYSIYNITDTAYGFMTKGCPRGCDFCHVKHMQGMQCYEFAPLSEFWRGQKYIKLLDPNITAARTWKNLLQQLIDSKAQIDFTQGVDMRLMTEEKAAYFQKIKIKAVHFAWDRYEDREILLPKFKQFKEITGWDRREMVVYVLVGDRERRIRQEDLERIMTLREIGYWPYVMIYDKEHLPRGHELKKLQRWVNNRIIWERIPTFQEYMEAKI